MTEQLVERRSGSPMLECTISDGTSSIGLVFFGRRRIAGIEIGAAIVAEGIAAEHRGRLVLLNPDYELRAR